MSLAFAEDLVLPPAECRKRRKEALDNLQKSGDILRGRLEVAQRAAAAERALQEDARRAAQERERGAQQALWEERLRALQEAQPVTLKALTVERIQKVAADFYGTCPKAVLSGSRAAEAVRARQAGIYLAKMLTKRSLNDVCARFQKDHATGLHAIRKLAGQTGDTSVTLPKKGRVWPRDPVVEEEIKALKSLLLSE